MRVVRLFGTQSPIRGRALSKQRPAFSTWIQKSAPEHMGLDIGGTLAKIVMNGGGEIPHPAMDTCEGFDSYPELDMVARFTEVAPPSGESREHAVELPLKFFSTPSHKLEANVNALSAQKHHADELPRRLATSGGGAHKLAPAFRAALNVELVAIKEMQSIVDGLIFLASHGPNDELFTVDAAGREQPQPWPQGEGFFPLLLVSAGSAVAVLCRDAHPHPHPHPR